MLGWRRLCCWDTYKGHDFVHSQLVQRLTSGDLIANPRTTRCRPALDTASSCARCQWRYARWPEHGVADSRFDQPLPGLGRSDHHSQSVKGGGASSPVSNVSIPSWCHRNHPSTAPPALGRWTCRRPHVWVSVRLLGLPCLRVEVPAAVRPGPPRPTPPDVLVTRVGRSTLHQRHGRELLYASVAPSRFAAAISLPRTCVCVCVCVLSLAWQPLGLRPRAKLNRPEHNRSETTSAACGTPGRARNA